MHVLLCPVCGQPSESPIEGKCRDCFLKSLTLGRIARVIHTVFCPMCGAFKRKGSWVESGHEIEEIITDAIRKNLIIHPAAEDIQVSITLTSSDPSIYQAHIQIHGTIKGIETRSELESVVQIKKETCDACSRLSGGYFESIIQIRAECRFPDKDELHKVLELVYDVVERQNRKGDRLAFVSKEEELHEGTDVYIGSNSTARQICRMAGERFGCTYSESPTLAGRKDGKDIYRITYSLRLPRFMPGDIISVGNNAVLIRHSGKRTTGTYLESGLEFSDTTDRLEDCRKIGTVRDAISAVLLLVEHDMVQVMHPETYRPVIVKKPAYLSAGGGEEVRAVIIGDDMFLLPPS